MTALEDFTKALEEYIRATADEDDGTFVVKGAVVSWEQIRFDEDGEPHYTVNCMSTDGTSYAETIGILNIAMDVVDGRTYRDYE